MGEESLKDCSNCILRDAWHGYACPLQLCGGEEIFYHHRKRTWCKFWKNDESITQAGEHHD